VLALQLELGDEVWRYIVSWFPGVVVAAPAFPLDEVLDLSISPAAVNNPFDLEHILTQVVLVVLLYNVVPVEVAVLCPFFAFFAFFAIVVVVAVVRSRFLTLLSG